MTVKGFFSFAGEKAGGRGVLSDAAKVKKPRSELNRRVVNGLPIKWALLVAEVPAVGCRRRRDGEPGSGNGQESRGRRAGERGLGAGMGLLNVPGGGLTQDRNTRRVSRAARAARK